MNRMGIEEYQFDKNDWGHFHDVILDVTWNSGKVNLDQAQMEDLINNLRDCKMDSVELKIVEDDE